MRVIYHTRLLKKRSSLNYLFVFNLHFIHTSKISSEIYTGLGTVSLKNGSLIAQGSVIPSRSSPYAVGVGSYSEEFDAAYAIVQVKDTLNDTYSFSEIMMFDDDDRLFMTEYGNVITGAGATSGIGTIDGRRVCHCFIGLQLGERSCGRRRLTQVSPPS